MRRLGNTQRRRTQGGAAAVEFALVMPILLLLVFAIIQYGLYFWAVQGGADSARSAARLAGTNQASTLTCAQFRAAVTDSIGQFDDGSTPLITRTYYEGTTDVPRSGSAPVEIGDTVEVHVSFKAIDLGLPVPFVRDGWVDSSARARVDYLDNGQPEKVCNAH